MNITDTQIAQLLDDIHTIATSISGTAAPARPAETQPASTPTTAPAPAPAADAPLSPVAADIASGRLQPDDQTPAFTD